MTSMHAITTAMFTVADQDAAVSWYTDKLGWEVRSDTAFGDGEQAGRWIEVAPPGSTAVLALNPAWGGSPGGGAVGIEASDLRQEHESLRAAGIEVGDLMGGEGPVPLMFSVADPDGNNLWILQTSSAEPLGTGDGSA